MTANTRRTVLAWVALFAGLVVGALLGNLAGEFTGRSEGRKLERAERDSKTVADLTALIDSHSGLIDAANKASGDMRRNLGARAALDAKTSKDFRDALQSTSNSRAGCAFPAGVMQQLSDARDRAAAAAAGGIRSGLPGTAGGAAAER